MWSELSSYKKYENIFNIFQYNFHNINNSNKTTGNKKVICSWTYTDDLLKNSTLPIYTVACLPTCLNYSKKLIVKM